jgi:hypothetical protein
MRPFLALYLAGSLLVADPAFAQQKQQEPGKSPAAVDDAPARPPVPNTLMDGTAVKLRLSETISSADAHVSQQVPFEVTEDVSVQGTVVISKGSPAIASVTTAEPKRRMGRGGKLDVNVDSVRLLDGEKAQLRAVKNTSGGGHVGAMTGAMVATGIVFFPAAPLFLFMHGKDITIPKGTEVTAFIQGDMKLNLAAFNPQAAPGAAAAAAQTATLTIESSTPGADIEIDGSFVGNTPSTLTVTPGSHAIAVKKKGFKDWSRTMTLSGSAIHLNADLEGN